MVNARAFKPLPLCSAKVGSSAKFCVVVYKSSLLWYGASISQSRFICQVLCTCIQGISALVLGGISQRRLICQVLCTVCNSSLFWSWGGPSAKEGLFARFGPRGSINQRRFIYEISVPRHLGVVIT